MARSSRLGAGMTRAEQICGWCYLPFYVVLLGLILAYLVRLLDLSVSVLSLNLAYVLINTAVTLLLFHRFLYRSLCNIPRQFWPFVQAVFRGLNTARPCCSRCRTPARMLRLPRQTALIHAKNSMTSQRAEMG